MKFETNFQSYKFKQKNRLFTFVFHSLRLNIVSYLNVESVFLMHNVHLKLLTDNFCCIFTVLENANFNFWFSSFLWIQTFLGFGITIFWKSAGFLSTVDWKPPIRLMSSSMMNIEWPNLGTSGRVGIGNHREPVTQANRVGEMLPGGLIIEK